MNDITGSKILSYVYIMTKSVLKRTIIVRSNGQSLYDNRSGDNRNYR
jgi:hypothetical protein